MNIDSIAEIEKTQASHKNKVIITFISILFLSIVVSVVLSYTRDSFRDNPEYLYLLLGVFFIGAIYFSKIYLLLTPKEIDGVIVDVDIRVVSTSRNAGKLEYVRNEFSEIELFIKTDSEKIIQRVYLYKGSNTALQVGDRVAIYRFIDNPVKIQ